MPAFPQGNYCEYYSSFLLSSLFFTLDHHPAFLTTTLSQKFIPETMPSVLRRRKLLKHSGGSLPMRSSVSQRSSHLTKQLSTFVARQSCCKRYVKGHDPRRFLSSEDGPKPNGDCPHAPIGTTICVAELISQCGLLFTKAAAQISSLQLHGCPYALLAFLPSSLFLSLLTRTHSRK